MSRTISAGMTAHLATRSHSRVTMILFELADSTFFGVTDHDQDIDYNLADAGLGEVTYQSGTGILRSDIRLTTGLDADNLEIEGPIGPVVTLAALLGGRYNRARVWIFEVNWKDPEDGLIKLLAGNVTDTKPEGGKFIFEIRSDFDRYNQVVGEIITNSCKADFGDARCGVTPEEMTGTVTAVYDALNFVVSFSGSYADAYFNQGVVVPLTGPNAGGKQVEIFAWYATGEVLLFTPLADLPEIGDTFTVRRGCSKLRMSDDPTVPTCLTYNNVINFRGFPEVPGSDKVLKMPIPGQGNEDD